MWPQINFYHKMYYVQHSLCFCALCRSLSHCIVKTVAAFHSPVILVFSELNSIMKYQLGHLYWAL